MSSGLPDFVRFRRCLVGSVWVSLALHLTPAVAASAHEHGVARFDAVIDGGTLVMTLDSPLDNVLGFEHAPRNDKQRAAVRRMEEKLQLADLMKPNAEAACKLDRVSFEHPYPGDRTKNLAAPAAQPTNPAPTQAGHADLEATWTFLCATPAALRQVDVGLFTQFSGLKVLKVQLAGPRGQTSTVLRPGKTRLTW